VIIRRRTATVTFAASGGWPPLSIPRGLAVPSRHPLRDLGTRQRWSGWTTSDLRLAFAQRPARPNLSQFSPYPLLRAQAEAGSRRTALMLLDIESIGQASSHHSLRTEGIDLSGSRDSGELICPICGHAGASNHYPCEECGVPPCPACGRCRCM
jgi:hypothetical protein